MPTTPRKRPRVGGIWPTRRDLTGCYVFVPTDDHEVVSIGVPDPRSPGSAVTIDVTRSEARLLARRINECLDATVIR